jgi:hypothetical protein
VPLRRGRPHRLEKLKRLYASEVKKKRAPAAASEARREPPRSEMENVKEAPPSEVKGFEPCRNRTRRDTLNTAVMKLIRRSRLRVR